MRAGSGCSRLLSLHWQYLHVVEEVDCHLCERAGIVRAAVVLCEDIDDDAALSCHYAPYVGVSVNRRTNGLPSFHHHQDRGV